MSIEWKNIKDYLATVFPVIYMKLSKQMYLF